MARRINFSWMNAFWSATPRQWATLNDAVAAGKPFSMTELGVRRLETKPRGRVHTFRDVQIYPSES